MIETIKAISSLWPLALCTAVPVTVFILRDPLRKFLPNIKRLKAAGAEIEVQSIEPKDSALNDHSFQAEESPPPESDTCDKTRKPDQIDETDRLEHEIAIAIIDGKLEDAEKLLEKWDSNEPTKKLQHEIRYNCLLCAFKKTEAAFKKLENYRESSLGHDDNLFIIRTLCYFYRETDQYAKAITEAKAGIEASETIGERISFIANQCDTLLRQGKNIECIELIQKSLSSLDSQEKSLSELYLKLAEAHKQSGSELDRCAALEKAAQLDPTNAQIIFDAAYAQSAINLSHLAFVNYRRRMNLLSDDSASQNNYAVQLSEFKILGKAADFYKKSKDNGNTLSAANLAYLYLDKGLYKEAESILQEAQKIEGHHENVDSAMVRLRALRAEEAEKMENLVKISRDQQTFFRQYANLRLTPTKNELNIAGTWYDEDGLEIQLIQSTLKIEATWGNAPKRKRIKGILTNSSLEIDYQEEDIPWMTGSKWDIPDYKAAISMLGWIDQVNQEIHFLACTGGTEAPLKFTIRRKNPS